MHIKIQITWSFTCCSECVLSRAVSRVHSETMSNTIRSWCSAF